jgi:hypothetical protein
MMPGERFANQPSDGDSRGPGPGSGSPLASPDHPFVAGEIADRGPLERGAAPLPDRRAREQRERERQAAWRDQAARALTALKADEGTAPINSTELIAPSGPPPAADQRVPPVSLSSVAAELDDEDEDEDDVGEDDGDPGTGAETPVLRVTDGLLPTLRVLPFGVSRKRLEQAIRELQLPVIIARNIDEADVVMTLRSEYRSKPPTVRDAEERGLPVYVLKSNTILQMHASLTSIFSLALDPREAALRETEEAIGIVIERSEAVELSPQSAYIRRLQHQMAERANLVSRSRGREPYRRVRLYPDQARVWR